MLLYDLYCPNCRKAYHYELWPTCRGCLMAASCRYCGWCDGDQHEDSCNVFYDANTRACDAPLI